MSIKTQQAAPPMPPLLDLRRHEAAIVSARWNREPTIPVPPEYDRESQATAFFGAADVPNSPYFPAIDFYHSYSLGSLSILPCFRTYQQTRDYTCASAVALMVMYHYGFYDWKELQISEKMAVLHHLPPQTRRPIPIKNLVQFFEFIGWQVESNLPFAARAESSERNPWRNANAKTFPTLDHFARFVRTTISAGDPIMVENIDWGGHWRCIIGYDDLGTEHAETGVLILADPHDTADHCQNGYVIEHIDKFYSTWYDVFVMEADECTQPWIVAHPPQKKFGGTQ